MINLGLIFHPVPTNFSIPIIRFCEPDCGKELDGIADQVQAEYLEMQRKAARAAYVRACFDPVNGREDKEALEEYYRAEQEFVKALYTLAEAVLKRKECTVIYDFLSESGTLTNNRISMLAFLAAIEKTRIW